MKLFKERYIKHSGLIVLSILALSSCKINQEYQQATVEEDALYRDVSTTDTTSVADMPWQQVFTDSTLQALISEGLDKNLDLQVAIARIKSAEANLRSSKGALLPSFSINGSASYSKLANVPSVATGFATEQYQLYGSTSWEIDLWGKLRSAKRAALANLLASDAYKRTVQTQLIASIATQYYTLLALDEQLVITNQNVAKLGEYQRTMEELQNASLVTGADLMQSKANLHATEAMVPDLKQQIRETENALSILLGRSPGAIERNNIEGQQPAIPLETGVPSLLLSNRPDVQQAEMQLRSAFEMVNSARAYFYPSITLSGAGGFTAGGIDELFDPSSLFGNIAGGLMQPVFNNGANKARLESNIAAKEEAYATFKQTLLTAGQEVSNALFAYDMADDKLDSRTQQLDALEKAVSYNEELLQYSESDYLNVLTAQQNLLSAQLNVVTDRLQKLQSMIELYRALGGGWK